jgi:hypothetical protein
MYGIGTFIYYREHVIEQFLDYPVSKTHLQGFWGSLFYQPGTRIGYAVEQKGAMRFFRDFGGQILTWLFMKVFRACFLDSTPRNAHSLKILEKQIPISKR